MDGIMHEGLHHPFVFAGLMCLLFFLWSWWRLSIKTGGKEKRNFPPSPRKLPIIGNLHQLSPLPHRDLQKLAKKHGPVMLLRMGTVPVLVVSSAEMAREIMITHDLKFVNRPAMKAVRKLLYNGKDVSFAPHGEYWKQMKSVLVLHLLSRKRVRNYRSIMVEETTLLVEKIIRESSSPGMVNLSEMFPELTNNGICRLAFGHKYKEESGDGKKILMLLKEFLELLGTVNIGDFVPSLSWISRVSGLDRRLDKVAKQVDDFLDNMIRQHTETLTPTPKTGENFVDILLEICKVDNSTAGSSALSCIDRDSIKALLMNVFAGGTGNVAAVLNWLMAELLRNPSVMEKLQKQVREIVGDKRDITDDDLEKMDYMKAVIKETFRFRPPAPLLAPRIAVTDEKINGYDIAKGTMIFVNAWAIGRDPEYWDEPDKFKPERFLNSKIDYKGLHFELIPFGAGRRGCPGISFVAATIEFVLANLMHKFNWELPDGARGEDLDMTERPGGTVGRAIPLLVVATQKY